MITPPYKRFPLVSNSRSIICLVILVLFAFGLLTAFAEDTAAPLPILEVGSRAEWLSPKEILMHTPGEELFLGILHPAAALFERSFSIEGAAREHRQYIALLREQGARVHTVVETLLAGTVDPSGQILPGPCLIELREFAAQFLVIDSSNLPAERQSEQVEYKKQTLASLHPYDLVRTILWQPTIHLGINEINTGFVATYELDPVTNLYFLRDQMITTAKGVVLSKMNSPQRAIETTIIKFVLAKLGIQPIYEVTGDGRLEGGDFLPAGDVAFLGQGLRTNEEGVRQLLENRVFDTPRVVIVKDSWKNQDQMHLDTFFNIIGPKLAVLVEERLGLGDPARVRERKLTIDVYELKNGRYRKILADGDFVQYLRTEMGFTLIPVSDADQKKYGINFLTVAANRILAVDGASAEYKEILRQHGVNATWMDFGNLTGGYGAAHCMTQVLRRVPVSDSH